jgi:solute carrier family 36 (proton-coupled amino acid transporter)
LQYYVPNDIVWRRVAHRVPKSKHNIAQIGIRSFMIFVMAGIGIAVPDLEPFISLVGAVFFSTLGKMQK